MRKVILLHGKNKTNQDVWYPWLGRELQKNGIVYNAPPLTTGDVPVLAEWLKEIDDARPDAETMLIGHSRGGMAVLRWLEQAPAGMKIAGAILVAANRGDMPDQAGGDFFYSGEYDFAKIKQHCEKFVVFHSRDDEWVPFEAGEHNAKMLGAQFVAFDDRGHFGGPTTELPELRDVILAY